MASVHESTYAGSWYPDDQNRLNRLIAKLVHCSTHRTGRYLVPGAVAIVVPHAALCYSGVVAAAAYRHLKAANPTRIFILGFSHRGGVRGVSIPDIQTYRLPVGEIVVDQPTVHELSCLPPFRSVDELEVYDHSVEVQLPLIRNAAPGVPIIPLYVGRLSAKERDRAARALAERWNPGDVLLASSDLTHYGREFHYQPFPVDSQTSARLKSLDFSVIDAASSLDANQFLETLAQSGATVCGYEPIALLLRTLLFLPGPEIFQQRLDYQLSGEITGDFSHSVSYVALAYFPRSSFELTEEEQDDLLNSGEATLRLARDTGRWDPVPPPRGLPALGRRGSVFVTLRHGKRLIGCVGCRPDLLKLGEGVPRMTLAAAFHDPRRPQTEHLPENTDIEISVLTPLKKIRGEADLQVGVHGAYLCSGAFQSILLPHVASDEGWTATQLLETLSMKAGLCQDAYLNLGTRLYIFQAQVFGRKRGSQGP